MSFCGIIKDVSKGCDNTALNLSGDLLAIRLKAISITKDPTNPMLITNLTVKDLNSGLYPLETSSFYPVKMEWLHNSVTPNYEVVEGAGFMSYTQTVGPVIINDSETKEGKANVLALTSDLWVIVSKVKGTESNDNAYHVYGANQGLKFVVAPSTPESGNRVIGSFMSPEGAGENTPNGLNLLVGTYVATDALYLNRFEVA